MGEWSGSDDDESLDSLRLAVERGCNFFDTAWAYGSGHSEKLLGRLIAQNPDRRLYAASKIPPKNRQWPSKRGFRLEDVFPPDYIDEYVNRTVENLGTGKVDLMQFHVWEDEWADDDRWVNALDHLKRQGLLEATGVSLNRWEPWNGIRTVQNGYVDAVQVIYNIFDQSPEDELFPACAENDVAVIARVPFDEGTLTGTLTYETRWPEGDWRNTYFVPENLRESVDRANALKPLVPEGADMPEMALRFILSNEIVATTIPGMRKPHHAEANLSTSEKGPLPEALRNELRKHRWDRQPTSWSQ